MDVVGTGYPVQDMLVRIEQIPKARVHVLSKILSASWQGGGMVATGLTAASVLGAEAGIIGVVGGDLYGQACIRDFEMNGVDTSHLLVDEAGTTDYTIVLTETATKERCFVAADGSRRRMRPEELDEAYIRQAKYLLVTEMDEVSIRAARIARSAGAKVVMDADLYEQRTMDHMDLIDVFICSEEFYQEVYQDEDHIAHCLDLQKLGPEIVLVTLGERGCQGVYQDTEIRQEAFTDIEIVDTNGAGDVFHGAFIYAMLQQWEPAYIVRFASAVAAIKCTRQGGRAGIPDASVAVRFMETGVIDYAEIDKRAELYKKGLF